MQPKLHTPIKYPFEKLEVWHLSKELVLDIYKITADFPKNHKYESTSQINRAVLSVSSNIAEGTSRTSRKDQAHFSQIAYSSLMEVVCQLIIALELKLLEEESYIALREKIEAISNKLNALRKYQLG